MKTLKRTWADISLDNLEYNYRSIRAHLPQGTKFLGVMKADAYGHGAVPVSQALTDLGAAYLAGLAVGFWDSEEEVSTLWKLDRRFEPAMDEERRAELLHNWHRAVGRAANWIE